MTVRKQLKRKELEVPFDDPFRNDGLNREEAGIALTEFVKSIEGSAVIELDAGWGMGKSTFLRMWRVLLEQNQIHSLYFNAWESDFAADAFIALICELENNIYRIKERYVLQNRPLSEGLDERLKIVGAVAKVLAKSIAVRAIEKSSAGIIQFDQIQEKIEEELDGDEESMTSEIEGYRSQKALIERFKDELAQLVQSIRPEENDEGSGTDSSDIVLAFLIDELDRCRPTYAIQLLERIKHLFEVPGVVFFIAVDRLQLQECVRILYGRDVSVSGYLRRFFDFEYRLPPVNMTEFFDCVVADLPLTFDGEYEKLLLNRSRLLLPKLSAGLGFKLRDQEKCIIQLAIAAKSADLQALYARFGERAFFLFSLLIAVRHWNRDSYEGYARLDLPASTILKQLTEVSGSDEFLSGDFEICVQSCLFLGRESRFPEEAAEFRKEMDRLQEDEQNERDYGFRARMIAQLSEGDCVCEIANLFDFSGRFFSE